MKDQYFGDVNDFRKYGLLRIVTAVSGVRSGVCWLRTAPDGRRDGEFRDYLHQPGSWRDFDPELYDRLRRLAEPNSTRTTTLAETWDLIPRATYQHRLLTDLASDRATYFAETWHLFRDCPLVFFDPDNGIEVPSVQLGRKGSAKYVYWPELEQASTRGHSILLYQHFPRQPRDEFVKSKVRAMSAQLRPSRVHVFRTAYVGFFLIPNAAHRDMFDSVGEQLKVRWQKQFDVSSYDVA